MDTKEMYENIIKDNEENTKNIRKMKVQSDIQTAALLLVFVFGISSLSNITAKIKELLK